jgi:RNA polymerase-binding transcription factor DksA
MSTPTLTATDRARLHALLLARKEQLLTELGDVQRATLAAVAGQDGTQAPEDPREQADRLAHNTVRDAEATRDHDELVAVRAALARWADGSLGECTDCGQPVGLPRLLAQPSAARCIGCQSKAESASH